MAKSVVLDDLIDALEVQNDEVTAYLDRDTGTVELALLGQVEGGSKRYVPLPGRWEVHEWQIMRRFCDTVEDERVKGYALRAIHGRGAFRRFKDELDRNGLLEGLNENSCLEPPLRRRFRGGEPRFQLLRPLGLPDSQARVPLLPVRVDLRTLQSADPGLFSSRKSSTSHPFHAGGGRGRNFIRAFGPLLARTRKYS